MLDNNYYYNWSVRAYDGEGYGTWTLARNISIQSDVTISLPVNTVNFGALNNSESKNTSTDNPIPLLLRNDGNSELNITINFTSLWESVTMPNETFRFKIRNFTDTCFIYENTTTSWTNAPLITTHAIQRLNFTSGYQEGCNNASIDLLVEVPINEAGGNKSSVITITSSLGEPGFEAD